MYIDLQYAVPLLFEYDPNKSAINLAKHGIDFEQAKLLWEDEKRVTLVSRSDIEPRYLTVAKLGGKHWSAFFTMRNDIIRLISVRRSRKKEISCYEKYH
ncbi:BrnT family toxin [Mannheimia sp. AT1]|uniref:BrnT family toxin n=1 Tax=Mannheimia cairinae TaxID=3025936 RepID=A0ABT5MR51_9PAST|nr:BrnT family toxin [Mannheimia cairinae]MDD0824443.1 BrnT family toxin [Mannheimia cairinae]MDD0825544.1 BrnT family toxin [Mannheimia cairinae]